MEASLLLTISCISWAILKSPQPALLLKQRSHKSWYGQEQWMMGPHSMLARSNGRFLPAAAAGSWAAAELSFHEVLPVCKCFLYPGRNYAERRGRRRIPDRKLKMLRTNLQACHKTKLGQKQKGKWRRKMLLSCCFREARTKKNKKRKSILGGKDDEKQVF